LFGLKGVRSQKLRSGRVKILEESVKKVEGIWIEYVKVMCLESLLKFVNDAMINKVF